MLVVLSTFLTGYNRLLCRYNYKNQVGGKSKDEPCQVCCHVLGRAGLARLGVSPVTLIVRVICTAAPWESPGGTTSIYTAMLMIHNVMLLCLLMTQSWLTAFDDVKGMNGSADPVQHPSTGYYW